MPAINEDTVLIRQALAYVIEVYRELSEENGAPSLGTQSQVAGHSLLQGFDCLRERAALGFVDQKVYVFRHDDVSVDAESVILTDTFQRIGENRAGIGCR